MKGNKLVYISTVNHVENEELMYDFDLEIIDENDKEKTVFLKLAEMCQKMSLWMRLSYF